MSCNGSRLYPRTLVDGVLAPYALERIGHELDKQAPRLFSDEAQAALDFLDLEKTARDFWPSRFSDAQRLQKYFASSSSTNQNDTRCRFLFILAANSRAKLKVSREMLALCFTQMHTMPEFLLFLFPFGLREYAQDFHFSGFRQRTRLATTTSNASPQDRQFQICFNLKSVERSDSDGWSIRHCAVHHSFHLDEVRTSWIIVKANELINQRIESATNDRGPLGATNFDSVSKALEASLRMHITFCDWSAENWRWYINSLEDNFEGMTRRTYSAPVNVPFSPTTESERFTFTSRTNTQRTDRSIFSFSRTQTQATEKNPFKKTVKQLVPAPRTYTNPDTGISQPLPPDEDDDDNDDEQKATVDKDDTRANDGGPIFSFGKLRKVHKIAEKANEALLVLKHNKTVLAQMKHYYKSILKRRGFPKALADSCYDTIEDFEISIEGLENDMQSQILRLETLLRLLEDRKTLVKQSSQMKKLTELRQDQLHSILDYQNTQTNKRSSKSMVLMTEDMNDIARKTKIETVSMKVITLVTLFFLPGTFISTLMSTAIFSSDNAGRQGRNPFVNLNPWQIYLAMSLPLTTVTLLFWAAFHLWEMRHEKIKKENLKAEDQV